MPDARPSSSEALVQIVSIIAQCCGIACSAPRTFSPGPQRFEDGLGCTEIARQIIRTCFGVTSDILVRQSSMHCWRRALVDCLRVLHRYFFEGMQQRRRGTDLEAVFAAVHTCLAMCWMRKARKCRQALLMGRIMSKAHRDALLEPSSLIDAGGEQLLKAATVSLMRLQWAAIGRACRHCDAAVVYGWMAHGFAYVGYGKRNRTTVPKYSGVASRWLEHAVLRQC